MRLVPIACALACAATLTGCASSAPAGHASSPPSTSSTSSTSSSPSVPLTSSRSTRAAPHRPAHVVVAVMENRSYHDIAGNRSAPYLNALARGGVSFTRLFAIGHPSQPNYIALFSGSTQGVTSDACPNRFTGDNLGHQLRVAHLGFTGYSESLPRSGYTGCVAGGYARKHAPWTDFANLPATSNQPFSAFPHNYSTLPALSFVVPNLDHDMHDGTIGQADRWLSANLGGYVQWAKQHDSLLVVTWDEDDHSEQNQIPTFVAGGGVKPGTYRSRVTLYSLLRTFEDWFGLPALGAAAHVAPIRSIWG